MMIKNYLKISLRNIYRQKFFSSVTILGLSAGFTCFLLILLYVHEEFSYDKFHTDSDRIYRVVHTITEHGDSRQTALVAPRIATWAAENLPDVQDMTRVIIVGRMTVGNEINRRDYERMWIADSNFFAFFNFPLVKGDPLHAMADASGILVTEEIADKYFDETPGLGQELYNNVYNSHLSGIVKDIPDNSHLDFEVMIPESAAAAFFPWWDNFITTNWTSDAYITYLKVAPNADIATIEQQITNEVVKHYEDTDNKQHSFYLQPLHDIHFYSEGIEGGVNVGGSKIYYSYLFLAIGIIILLVACFNYMNLSTTAAVRRSKEVGLRKTVGAQRSQLIFQFLSEAILLTVIALILAVALVGLTIPYLNDFMNKSLTLDLMSWEVIVGLILLAVVIGIFSGIYPAFITARISPAQAIKSGTSTGGQKFTLRKALVVSQFAVAIIMIASTVIIYRQLQFIKSQDLGFQVDNLMVIDINSGSLRSNYEAIKADMRQIPGLENVSVSSRVPGEWKVTPLAVGNILGSDKKVENIFIGADHDFLNTFDIHLVEGRNFSTGIKDSLSILLNKAAVDAYGLHDPVGAEILIEQVNWNGSIEKLEQPFRATVVGVVDNFTFESVRNELKPMIIGFWKNPIQNIDYFTVRFNTNDVPQLLADLQAVNSKYDQENPLEYNFLNSQFERFYIEDQQRGKLFLIFSLIVVVLSCMGLFALASYITRLRTKEVGIRKVLGARAQQIIYLLVKDFAILVAIAFFIAIPVGYLVMDSWLEDFAYKVQMSWWYFAVAGIAVFILALLTISVITFKIASANPVNSLRSD